MFITKLKIHNFRILINSEYNFKEKINIFVGDNGVGKTSILEAISYISSGKSFRKGSFKNLINFNSDELTVYIESQENNTEYILAVSKNSKGYWKGKINSNAVSKQSSITKHFPVIAIDPEIYRLVDYGPVYRRNFLDWLVFHVKHDYLNLWKTTYKCIKHLNFLYKNKGTHQEILTWESVFITNAEEITKIRIEFFNIIKPLILETLYEIDPEIKCLNLSFNKGWSDNIDLKEQLELDRNINLKYGSLQHGPHKMDIKIKVLNQAASHTLSRGQKKILSIVFHMAYIKTLMNYDINPILCLDDFDAEIHTNKLNKVVGFFNNSGLQIFITSVQENKIKKAFPQSEVFHVKQV